MITIENYEIFYLDYLEGDLNAELTAELLEFLALNPELKEDNNLITTLKSSEDNYLNKTGLKHFDEEEKIALNNVEGFMIANLEGLLNTKKSEELSKFILNNKQLEVDNALYTMSILAADQSIKFNNKKSLKHKESIALWPILTIAAGVALIISLGSVLNTNQPNEKYMFGALDLEKEQSNSEDEYIDWTVVHENILAEENQGISKTKRVKAISKKIDIRKNENITGLSISKPSLPSFTRFEGSELKISTENLSPDNSDLADNTKANTQGFEQMNNPIWAVTNVVGAITKTDVDFRKGKSTATKAGGFKIKIGEFEVYKKTSKKM